MAITPNSTVSVQTPKNGKVQILPADTTTQKTVYTGNANGTKVVRMTQAGTVILTIGNVAAQATLVTDAHIDAAASGMFNSLFQRPMG